MIPCLENIKVAKTEQSMVTECWVNQLKKLQFEKGLLCSTIE
jgi:hypothetical protein